MKTLRRHALSKEISSVEQNDKKDFSGGKQPHHTKRFLMWCVANFVLLPLLRLGARHFGLFKFLFVVYPGSKNNVQAYAPLWFQKIFKDVFKLSMIGVMAKGTGTGRGLIVTLSESPEGFSKEDLQKTADRVRELGKKLGVSSIALAGRLPTLFEKRGKIALDPPFIKGDRGAVFTVVETCRQLLAENDAELTAPIGIVGVGYLGGRVATRLAELGYPIIGYDTQFSSHREEGIIVYTNDPNFLYRCKMVIVLTAKGEDAADIVGQLQDDVVVVDDTHPQMPADLIRNIHSKGGKVYRSTMGLEGVRSFPRLPGYRKEWIPGCVVESLVINGEGSNHLTQEQFDEKGREIGLTPFLVSPRGEG